MADMPGFGEMDIDDRGGKHDFAYEDARHVPASDGLTPSHTVGPFFAYGLTPGPYGYTLKEIHTTSLVSPVLDAKEIILEGQVFDGNGVAVHDAMIELIQADNKGEYRTTPRNDGFTGYFRAGTGVDDAANEAGNPYFRFKTIKPGSTQKDSTPFITLILTMRGLLNHCITRIYFEGDDHSTDPVLAQVPEARRHTLIAKKTGENHYRFNIHMQGENETVFFDI